MKTRTTTLLLGIALLFSGCDSSPPVKEEPRKVLPAHRPPVPPAIDSVNAPMRLGEKKLDDVFVSIDVEDVRLEEAIKVLTDDLPLNIVFERAVDKDRKVSVRFRDVHLAQALDGTIGPLGYQYRIEGNTIHIQALLTRLFEIPNVDVVRTTDSEVGGSVLSGSGGGTGQTGGGTGTGTGTGGGQGAAGSSQSFNGSFTVNSKGGSHDVWQQVVDSVKQLLSEDGEVVASRFAGTLMVTDRAPNMGRIEQVLDRFKQAHLQQVIIEARLVEVLLNDQLQAGIDWQNLRQTVQGGDLTVSPVVDLLQDAGLDTNGGTLSLAQMSGGSDFELIFRALQSQGETEIISQPKISVLSGHTAVFNVGRVVPFVSEVTLQQDLEATSNQQQVSLSLGQAQEGVMLGVTPFVSEDGTISMQIVPLVSEIPEFVDVEVQGQTQKTPVVEVRQLSTMIRTRDGEMVVLGGLIQEKKRNVENSVPGLGDIPAVGTVFRNVTEQTVKSELVILLRVHLEQLPRPVVPEGGTSGTADEKVSEDWVFSDLPVPAPSDAVLAHEAEWDLEGAMKSYRYALSQHRLNNFDRAIGGYRAALDKHPEHHPARYNLASCLLQTRKTALAKAQLLRLRKAFPENTAVAHNLALAHRMDGRVEEAVALLEENLAGERTPLRSFLLLADMEEERGNLGRAEKLYRWATHSYPGAFQPRYLLARIIDLRTQGSRPLDPSELSRPAIDAYIAALREEDDRYARHAKAAEARLRYLMDRRQVPTEPELEKKI